MAIDMQGITGRIEQLSADGTKWGLSAEEEVELQFLVDLEKRLRQRDRRNSVQISTASKWEEFAVGIIICLSVVVLVAMIVVVLEV